MTGTFGPHQDASTPHLATAEAGTKKFRAKAHGDQGSYG